MKYGYLKPVFNVPFDGSGIELVKDLRPSWHGTESYTNGVVGKAAHFNGSSSVSFKASDIGLGNEITISFWANIHASGILFNLGQELIEVQHNGNYLQIAIGNNWTWINVYTPPKNEFHHYVLYYNKKTGETEMYIDTELKWTGSRSSYRPWGYPSNKIGIGARYDTQSGSPNSFLTGEIDEFLIFNRKLKQNEIVALFNKNVGKDYVLFLNLDKYKRFTKETIIKMKNEIEIEINSGLNNISLILVKNKHFITNEFVDWLLDNDLAVDFLKLYGFWKSLKDNGIDDFFATNKDLIEEAANNNEHVLFQYAFYENNLEFITDDIVDLKNFLKTDASKDLFKTIEKYESGKELLRDIFNINNLRLIADFVLNRNDKKYYEYVLTPGYIEDMAYEDIVSLFGFLNLSTEYLKKVEGVSNKNIYEIESSFIPKHFFPTKKIFSTCKVCDNLKFLNIFSFHHHPYWTTDGNTKKTITRDMDNVFTLEGDDVNGYNKTIVASFKEILPVCYDKKIKDYIYLDANGYLKSLTNKDIKDSELALFVDVAKKYKFIIKESPNKYTWKSENLIETNYGNGMLDYKEFVTNDLNIKNVSYSKIYNPSIGVINKEKEIAFFPFTKDFKEFKNRYTASPTNVSITERSLLFKGNGYCFLNTPTNIYNNSFAVSLWVKDFSSGVIFETGYYVDYIMISAAVNKLGFSVRPNSWYEGGHGGSYNVDSKQWHHVIITGDNKTIKFYIDGIYKGETANKAAGTNKRYTILGAEHGAGGSRVWDYESYYNGKLKNLKIYNTMLSEEEVYLLYVLEGENNA